MTKHDGMTKVLTKEFRTSPSKHRVNDGMTKDSMKTLLYIYFFIPLGTCQKTLRQRHSVRIRSGKK